MPKINTTQKKDPCELHACMRHAMRICRWFGYFPVRGLHQLTVEGIRCNFKSIYSMYNIATILGQIIVCCFVIVWFFENEITLSSFSVIVFFVNGLIMALLLTKLAQQWPRLIAKAQEVEHSINIKSKSVTKKCTIIAYIYISLAIVEHLLYLKFTVKFIKECIQEDGRNNDIIEDLVKYTMPYFFNYIPYNIYAGIIMKIISVQATFIWSFADVMTICFSVYITSYLQNLNKIIYSKQKNNGLPWSLLREYYSKVILLIKDIDNQLSSFILLSLFSDLYFVCVQLFKSLHQNNTTTFNICDEQERKNMFSSPDYLLYYIYSFLFLLLRALSASLFAANVHAAAQQPIIALYDVSADDYDMELHRFQSQLRYTEIALTGKFFTITRNMVMQVIGTIITYELILFQIIIDPEKITWPKYVVYNTSVVTTVN